MRKLSFLLIMLLLLSLLLPGCGSSEDDPLPPDNDPVAGKVFYVSPDGDDKAEGTESEPLATLSGAKQAVRTYKTENGLPDGGIVVYFKSGTYLVNSTLEFSEADSGEAGKPVVYQAAPDAQVLFSGGITLNGADFVPASESIKSQLLDPKAAENLLEIDLETAGCYDFTDSMESYGYRQELYVNDQRQTVARWPNTGYAVCEDSEYDESTGDAFFPIPEEKARLFAGLSSFRMYGAPIYDWSTVMNEVTSDDVIIEKSSIALRGQGRKLRYGASFFMFNILPELDVPGEYYWDVDGKKLYYYPDGNITNQKIVFSQYASNWFILKNASYLAFKGLTFENARNAIFNYEEIPSSYIDIRDCTFRCLGCDAIRAWGDHFTIFGNEIYDLGAGGISLSGGTLDTLVPSDSLISNNRIHDFGRTYTVYRPAVEVNGFGFEISHNEFYNAPHEALAFNCGGSVIEYNYVHNVCSETSDAGAFYSGRRYDWGGNVIRYNYLKDIVDTTLDGNPNGIYYDDGMSDQVCYGNILENIGGAPLALGGGKHLNVYNNIIIHSGSSWFDNRGTGWMSGTVAYKSGYMWTTLIDSNYMDALHRYYFPKNLLMIERNEKSSMLNADDPGTPSYSNVWRNIIIGPNPFGVPEYEIPCGSATDNVSYDSIEDVGFVDPENGNYNLKEDARVFRDIVGFEPIPFDEIGLLAQN